MSIALTPKSVESGHAAPREQLEQSRNVNLRSASGSDRQPPDLLPLTQAETQQLWLGIHLLTAGALEPAAAVGYRFSSLVSTEAPDGLLLEVKGSLRLFGGTQALLRQIAAQLQQQGLAAQMAIAPTPSASLWLARRTSLRDGEVEQPVPIVENLSLLPRYLASLPLVCLRCPEEQLRSFDALGMRTIGDLMRLPRRGLARRLGSHWLQILDRALGHAPEPRRKVDLAERFADSFEPETPIETSASLQSQLDLRQQSLRDFLRSRQVAIDSFELRLLHREHAATVVQIVLAAPAAQVDRLWQLLHERISVLAIPAPVVRVRMRSGPLFSHRAVSEPLLRKIDVRFRTDPTALPQLIERLQARLGAEALCGIRCAADHRPERAAQVVNVFAPNDSLSLPPFVRPVWICPVAKRIFSFESKRWRIERGPERIESGWWDGQDIARDYFVVRDGHAARLWVYRDRHPPYGWYLHGWFG